MWASAGAHISYMIDTVADPQLSDLTETTYVDTYQYGVRMNFRATGLVGVFDFWTMLNTFLNGLVLLSSVSVVARAPVRAIVSC